MTTFGSDHSDFDSGAVVRSFATHKATEGVSVQHAKYGPRLNLWRDAGVAVLGAYHVLRTPSAADGSLAEQLSYWVAYMDAQTPWWRTFPAWLLQVDAERWSYDQVSAATVLEFAGMLVDARLPGLPITYASRGQFGDSLTGIRTPLWNADYRGSALPGGSYAGDGWTSSAGAPAGWAPYSGRTPLILQYASNPGGDLDAYRGALDELGDIMINVWTDASQTLPDGEIPYGYLTRIERALWGPGAAAAEDAESKIDALAKAVAALSPAGAPPGLSDADVQRIAAAVLAQLRAALDVAAPPTPPAAGA